MTNGQRDEIEKIRRELTETLWRASLKGTFNRDEAMKDLYFLQLRIAMLTLEILATL